MKNKYILLAIIHLVLSIGAICLYLPYTLEAFDMAGFEWFQFVPNLLKGNYNNVLIYFGVFLLVWFIGLNLITILSRINLPKFLCKITVVLALVLPLIYVLALENEAVLSFWLNIKPNIKMVAYIILCISWGNFSLALLYNFTHDNRANLHHLFEALTMCVLITLMIMCNGWCGWKLNSVVKPCGIMIGLFAIYLPISSIILMICHKNRD